MLTNILWLIFFGAIVYLMVRGGGCCGSHGEDGGHHDHGGGHDHGDHRPATTARLEAETKQEDTDPVCSMPVADGGPTSVYRGRVYHFCSERCRKLFDLHPGKYAAGA